VIGRPTEMRNVKCSGLLSASSMGPTVVRGTLSPLGAQINGHSATTLSHATNPSRQKPSQYLIQSTATSMDIDRLITLCVQKAEVLEYVLTKLPDSKKWLLLDGVAMELVKRFQEMDSVDDIDRAITLEERAIETTTASRDRASVLKNLGIALQSRFERNASMDDLDRAITAKEQAVELTPIDDPSYAASLSNLGIALQRRFERLGVMDDLNNGITKIEQAVKATPGDDPDQAMYLNNLGNGLRTRFEITGSKEDLDRAISTTEQAVQVTPTDDTNLVGRLSNLGMALMCRFEISGVIEDLNRAIAMGDQFLTSIPTNHPHKGRYLNTLGNAFQKRYESTGSIEDLNRGIALNEQAVESTPVDHPEHIFYLNNFGNALQRRFERTGLMNDLEQAIVAHEQAVKSVPINHVDRGACLSNLANALVRRFERSQSMEDLDRAIAMNDQAVAAVPVGHPDRPIYLSNLAAALQTRFEWTGLTDDLDRAIVTIEQAVESTGVGHSNRAMYLNNLASALRSLFDSTGSMDALEYGIRSLEQAIESSQVDNPHHSLYLNNLGYALQSRHERTKIMKDLDEAIIKIQKAIELVPVNHPYHAMYFSNLASAWQTRFETTRSGTDLAHAIDINEQAVRLTPRDHPSHTRSLHNLGTALYIQFETTGSIEDLNRAITVSEQALELISSNHPDRAKMLNNLGNSLRRRFEKTNSLDDLNRAVAAKEEAAESDLAPPSIKLEAARSCADLLISQRYYSRAKPILKAAIQLLPRITLRHLNRSDQEFNISQFSSITSRAVSLHIADGDPPYDSLKLLDLGRGVLASLQLELRTDISTLETSHPDLARQFRGLREQLDPPRNSESPLIEDTLSLVDPTSPESSKSVTKRRALQKQFDDLLLHIRSLKGFENFLQSLSESELHSLVERPTDTIVVFNISDIRSDAFLITATQIRSIPLPLLTPDSVESIANRFIESVNEASLRRHKVAMDKMDNILGELWEFCVKPILDELGFIHMPPSDVRWPRIWWVGSGLLNILPIHAAGYHNSAPRQAALDRVISSYAPSVKSLAYARKRTAQSHQIISKQKAVLIAMPTTPEKPRLPSVETEIKTLEDLFVEASIEMKVMRNPTRMAVLSELSEYTIVHFTCHGHSAHDPSQSSLLLEDWKVSPLTVSDLASSNSASGKFAFLSACFTSTMRHSGLLDESINLSSALQLCGYPSVLSGLWHLRENHAVEVARTVYEWILKGRGELDLQRSAEGLHKAARDLRERTRFNGRTDPVSWASFIHTGI